MLKMANGTRGAQSLKVRRWVENIIRDVEQRDMLSQMAAIYYWYLAHQSYLKDPVPSEMVRDPEAVVEDIEDYGKFMGDCDCAATFLTGAFRSIGIRAVPIRVGFRTPSHVTLTTMGSDGRPRKRRVPYGTPFTHVLVKARDQHGREVAVDPVAGGRTWRMLRRTKRFG